MINKIHEDVKTAMREKNEINKNALKMVINKANAIAKEAKVDVPTNEMVTKAIKSELKQLEQTMTMLKDGGKTDSTLYTESEKQVELLNSYLPKQLSEDELRKKITTFVVENNIDIKNRGLTMKSLMNEFKDVADGKTISKIVGEMTNK